MHVQKTLGKRKGPLSGFTSSLLQKFRALHHRVGTGIGANGRLLKTSRRGVSSWRKQVANKLAKVIAKGKLTSECRSGGGGIRAKVNYINKMLNKEKAERNYTKQKRGIFLARRKELGKRRYDSSGSFGC